MTDSTNKYLADIRRARRKRDRVNDDLERAIVAAADAGISLRLIGIAAGQGKSTVHRFIALRSENVREGA